jgi:hypothetical protein
LVFVFKKDKKNLMTFNNLPGNKGVPEPKQGFEQRKIAMRNLMNSALNGWLPRDNGKYTGDGWVLCEKKIEDGAELTTPSIKDYTPGEPAIARQLEQPTAKRVRARTAVSPEAETILSTFSNETGSLS